jgi:hypothetical protein
VDRYEESLTASEDDGIVVRKFSPMAITNSAITLDEELVAPLTPSTQVTAR